MTRLALVCLLLLCGCKKSSQQAAPAAPGNLHGIAGKFPACPTPEAYKKLVGLMVEKDEAAAYQQYHAAGCIDLNAGEQVYAEGQSGLGTAGVRREGETQIYWTATEALK